MDVIMLLPHPVSCSFITPINEFIFAVLINNLKNTFDIRMQGYLHLKISTNTYNYANTTYHPRVWP